MDRKRYLVGVHPFSHALECEGKIWGGQISPALRSTDYKCPHCVMIEYEDYDRNTRQR